MVAVPRGLQKALLMLFGLTVVVRAATAWTLQHAGYFDAFYYFHLAQNMAEGRGLIESVLWNYLDDPQQQPRPGNQYWMPLTNLWAWLGIEAVGGLLGPWRAAQLPFVLGSALLPPFSAWLAWQGWGRRDWALAAGVLTLFSGFYFTYWVVTDTYTPFALAVALALVGAWRGRETGRARWWVLAGSGTGLAHLARVDGALLVLLLAGLLIWEYGRGARRSPGTFVRLATAAAGGYLLWMAPWWLYQWQAVGTPFPGGGTQTLWLRAYSEIFSAELALTPQRYLAWGAGAIVASKARSVMWASLIVLGSMQFFLAPFVLLSLRRAARLPLFQPFLLYTAMLLLAMPLLFTFPARHGSLLHSAAALLPWMMALVPAGIERAVGWLAARRPAWEPAQATRVLGGGFVGLAMLITLLLYAQGVWLPPAPNALTPRWNERTALYDEAEKWLRAAGVPRDERILVGDPPSYYVRSGRPALVIPTDGPEVVGRVARRWDARWLLLESDYGELPGYAALYEATGPVAGWRPVATLEDPLGQRARLLRFEGTP